MIDSYGYLVIVQGGGKPRDCFSAVVVRSVDLEEI